MRIRPIQVAYATIGCFFAVERLLRKGESAKSWKGGASDQGTTRGIGAAFGLSINVLLLAPLLNRLRIGRLFGDKPAWAGVAVMLVGLVLRIWASLVLGASYTRTLRTAAEQRLITEGPYKVIRNPGYLGVIMLWLGGAVASGNAIAILLIAPSLLRAYKRRMDAEEIMLAAAFPREFESYARHTRRLLPFVY